MPYPETAEGFVIKDTKNWSTFKKEEVCASRIETTIAKLTFFLSSNSSLSKTMTLISQLTPAVFAAAMSTQSLADGLVHFFATSS